MRACTFTFPFKIAGMVRKRFRGSNTQENTKDNLGPNQGALVENFQISMQPMPSLHQINAFNRQEFKVFFQYLVQTKG